MGRRKYNSTIEECARVAAKYAELSSAYKAAEELGIPVYAVYAAVRRLGQNTSDYATRSNASRRQIGPDLEPLVMADYLSGMTYSATAERHGVTPYAVRECVERSGKLQRRRGPTPIVTESMVADIMRIWTTGKPCLEVARSVGVSIGTVKKAIKSLGESTARKHFPRGGKFTNQSGYVMTLVPSSHAAMRGATGYVLEHRYVMAVQLGRLLAEHETVHHINGDKTDNRIENLQLRQGKHGNGVAHVCADCGSHNVVASRIKD